MSKQKNGNEESQRRKVIKTALAGGTVISTSILPTKWEKPLLDKVVLPAHAQMSTGGGSNPGGGMTNVTAG